MLEPAKLELYMAISFHWCFMLIGAEMADMTSVDAEISRRKLKWAGHMVQIPDHCIPKGSSMGSWKTELLGRAPQRPTTKTLQKQTIKNYEAF